MAQLSFPKSRHLDVAEQKERIISINTEGTIEWAREDKLKPASPGRPEGRNQKRDEDIRRQHNDGQSIKSLATEYGLTERRIRGIVDEDVED